MDVKMLTSDKAIAQMVDNTVLAGLVCKGRADKQEDVITKVYLGSLIELGHESVLEHIVVSYHIQDISRAILQELARHRHISLSVESTRTTLTRLFKPAAHEEFTKKVETMCENMALGRAPLAIDLPLDSDSDSDNVSVGEDVELCIDYAIDGICGLRDIWRNMTGRRKSKAVNDCLKYFLPEAWPTSLVLTLNLRELRHILKLRTSYAAHFEFQLLAHTLYDVFPDAYKWLLDDCIDPECVERIHIAVENGVLDDEEDVVYYMDDDDDDDERGEEELVEV